MSGNGTGRNHVAGAVVAAIGILMPHWNLVLAEGFGPSELPKPEQSVEMRLIVGGQVLMGWDANHPLVVPDHEIVMTKGESADLAIQIRDASNSWKDVSHSEKLTLSTFGTAHVRRTSEGLKLIAEHLQERDDNSAYRWTYGNLTVFYNLESAKKMADGDFNVARDGKVGAARVVVRLRE